MLAMVKKIKTKDNRTNLYIHLRRSRDCLLLWLFGCVRACVCVGLRVSYALHLLILDSCYALHINALSIELKCTSKGATRKLN